MIERRLLVAAAALALVVACAAPQRDYTIDQIAEVDNLEELMDVQATVADPRFKLARSLEGQDFSDEDWAQFADMATRLQATTERCKKFSPGADFDRWNLDLQQQAIKLTTAVKARNSATSLKLVGGMRKTCAACHRKYK